MSIKYKDENGNLVDLAGMPQQTSFTIDFSNSTITSINELLQKLANDVYPKTLMQLIPDMTSNTTPYGSASANYVYSGRYAYYGMKHSVAPSIYDGTSLHYMNSHGDYLQYDFENLSIINKITFKGGVGDTPTSDGKSYYGIYYLDKENNLIELDNQCYFVNKMSGDYFTDVEYDITIPITAKAIRIVNNNVNNFAVAQLQAYGSIVNK